MRGTTIESICVHAARTFVEGTDPEDSDESIRKGIQSDVKRVRIILEMLQPYTGPCLEIGTGYGFVALSLAAVRSDLEISTMEHPDRAYVSENAYTATLRDASVALATCDLQREPLPYSDGRFSIVICSEVLEHIPTGTTDHLVAEIARVLAPSGVGLISSPNLGSAAARLRLLRGNSPFDLPVPLDRAGGTYGHVRIYTVSEVARLAERHGLRIIQTRYENWSAPHRKGLHGAILRGIGRGWLSADWFVLVQPVPS